MKGIVFTELLEMVEAEYGAQVVNNAIDKLDSKTNGVYTAIGYYEHTELVDLLKNISAETETTVNDLMYLYGRFLFKKFFKYYPVFFEKVQHPFEFLGSIDSYIHKEVVKLYPDAELPKFTCSVNSPDSMEMIYSSKRRMGYLAKGLIEECLVHFEKIGTVEMTEINSEDVLFTIETHD